MTAHTDRATANDELHAWLLRQLSEFDTRSQRRVRSVTRSGPGWCERDGRRLLNFASNDYLGLAQHPRVREAFADAAGSSVGSAASALVTGRSEWQDRLEHTIADFEGTESALVFPSGYAANVGTLSSLMTPDDVVFSDRLNHASLIDGCRLSGAQLRVFRHDQLDKLDDRLSRPCATGSASASQPFEPGSNHTGRASGTPVDQRTFIVTDGVFSMDGAIAPLRELCDISGRHGAILVVDEAHGTGVLGEHGRGACELLGVEHRVPIRIGTLSKALGTLGGFVAGSRELIDYLWNAARSQFFSTALPPAVCAAAVATFDVIREEPQLRERMQSNSRLLTSLLRSGRSQFPSSPKTANPDSPDQSLESVPIVPVWIGTEAAAVRAAELIEDDGFLVACVRPPTVPNNTSRLRISVSASHTEDDIQRLAESVIRAVESVQGDNR